MYVFFITFILLIVNLNFIQAEKIEKEYNVRVELYKKYEDTKSMGAKALSKYATLIENNGKYRLRVKFVHLEVNNFVGYLGELEVEEKAAKVISEYDITDEYNDKVKGTDKKLKGKLYPKELEFDFDP
ncbi:Iron Transport-associated domain-containing protein [Peptoniphilus asaccharolyticus DSM 20463]|uniref:Iron Transport-associated domain-containing protein n=1 Tax=Peptoniphilus asaccharolyticus DSM 20463 TaxID=573058 RepID=A0A1W1VET7_PEPAS|nr:Iron Transport-associated domain-containing protein [Peptoniphilus asaccharolyticus DSM 20463]